MTIAVNQYQNLPEVAIGTALTNYFAHVGTDTAAREMAPLPLDPIIKYLNAPQIVTLQRLMAMSSMQTGGVAGMNTKDKLEWMQAALLIRRVIINPAVTAAGALAGDVLDSSVVEVNDAGTIIKLDTRAKLEGFETGQIYKVSKAGSATIGGSADAVMCIGIREQVSPATTVANSQPLVQFIAGNYNTSTKVFTYVELATTVDLFTVGASGVLTFRRVGNGGAWYNAAGAQLGGLASNTTQTSMKGLNGATSKVNGGSLDGYTESEGSLHGSHDAVSEVAQQWQDLMESYDVTEKARKASKGNYGGDETLRQLKRKFITIITDMEVALLTNNAATRTLIDGRSDPKTKFTGYGVGSDPALGGFIQSHNGYADTIFQLNGSAPVLDDINTAMDAISVDQWNNSTPLMVFGGMKPAQYFGALADAATNGQRINYEGGGVVKIGRRVTEIVGNTRNLEFIYSPTMAQNPDMEDYMLVLDPTGNTWWDFTESSLRLRTELLKDGNRTEHFRYEWTGAPQCDEEGNNAIFKLTYP